MHTVWIVLLVIAFILVAAFTLWLNVGPIGRKGRAKRRDRMGRPPV